MLIEMSGFAATFVYLKNKRTHTAVALAAGVVWFPFWLVTGWRAWERHQGASGGDAGGVR
jgi:hypothetical protein